MNTFKWILQTSLTVLVLTAVTGCPLRKERIAIGRNGAVRMELTYAGTAAELSRFDALPSEASGWRVQESVKHEDKDKEPVHELTAERDFAPGVPLPRNFLPPGAGDADLVLDFPTSLRVEDRPDGKYYYFTRIYSPRPWAYAHYWEEHFIDEEIKRISAKPVEQLTTEDRLQVIQVLVAVEAHRHVEFAKTAMANALSELTVEFGLKARRAMLDVYEQAAQRLPETIAQCEKLAQDQRDACYLAESDGLTTGAHAALIETLRKEASLSGAQLAAFNTAFQRAKRYYDITNDLGGHGFEIEVTMPGEVVAHNAEKIETDESRGEVAATWEFDGRAFRDRAYELVVVSRVTAGSGAEKNQGLRQND